MVLSQVLIRLKAEQDLSLTAFVAGAISIILNSLTTSDSSSFWDGVRFVEKSLMILMSVAEFVSEPLMDVWKCTENLVHYILIQHQHPHSIHKYRAI